MANLNMLQSEAESTRPDDDIVVGRKKVAKSDECNAILSFDKNNEEVPCGRKNRPYVPFLWALVSCDCCQAKFCENHAPVLFPPDVRFCDICSISNRVTCFSRILEKHAAASRNKDAISRFFESKDGTHPQTSALWGVIASKLHSETERLTIHTPITNQETINTYDKERVALTNLRTAASQYPQKRKMAEILGGQQASMTAPDLVIFADGTYYVVRVYDRAHCYARAIELDPGKKYWGEMAAEMSLTQKMVLNLPDRSAPVGSGKTNRFKLTKMDCYRNALFAQPTSHVIWCNLANDLATVDKMTMDLPDEVVTVRKEDCYKKSIELAPKHASAWSNLGFFLAKSKDSSEIRNTCNIETEKGKEEDFDHIKCFVRAITLEPNLASAWANLANYLGDESVTITTSSNKWFGKEETATYDKKACAIRAVKLSQHNRQSFALNLFNLRCLLTKSEWEKGDVEIEMWSSKSRKHVPHRFENEDDILKFIVDKKLPVYNVKLRAQLSFMSCKSSGNAVITPEKIQYIHEPIEVRKDKMLGSGVGGTVYEGTWRKGGSKKFEEKCAVKCYKVDINELDLAEVKFLVEDGFRRCVVECFDIRFKMPSDPKDIHKREVEIYMEKAQGSLDDVKRGKLKKNEDGGGGWHRDADDDDDDDDYAPVDMSDIEFFGKESIEYLQLLHEKGVTHGDIKPGNILIFEEGQIKLADFGFAKSVEEPAATTQSREEENGGDGKRRPVKGTRMYQPPCYAIGQEEPDPATAMDIWSWAATMCDLAEKGGIKYDPLTKKPPEIPVRFSTAWKEVLEQCFEIDPKKRPEAKKISEKLFSSSNLVSPNFALNSPRGESRSTSILGRTR